MGYIIWFTVSILLILGPIIAPSVLPGFAMDGFSQVLCIIAGSASLVFMAFLVVVTRLYQKPTPDEALVRSGLGGLQVAMEKGILFVPLLHTLSRVSLRTIKIPVKRTGTDALITADYLRADLQAEFYIRITADQKEIISAFRTLGVKATDEAAIKDLLLDKLVSALRTVAAKSDLFDLNSNREKFASDVKGAVTTDLSQNGFTLETVTISNLDQADIRALRESENVFNARGTQKAAEIIQDARVRTNVLEREASEAIEAQNVATRKKILGLDLERTQAEANQALQVSIAEAESKKKAETFRIQQEQDVEAREIEKSQLLAQRDLEKQQAIETREIELAQAVETADQVKKTAVIQAQQAQEVANIEREQASLVATVAKQRAEEVARREQQIAIAQKEGERAAAEAIRLMAEKDRETNAQAVATVQAVQTAEREKAQSVLKASAAAETAYVTEQRKADAEAYRAKAIAEGKMAAAEADFVARVKAAEGEKAAAEMRALGARAEQIVPVEIEKERVAVDRGRQMIAVDVAKQQVEVEARQVELERQRLQQQDEHGKVAIDFEIAKLEIERRADVQIATAQATAQMLSSVKMTLFGTPENAAQMQREFFTAMRLANAGEGLLSGLDGAPRVKEVVTKMGETAGALADMVLNKPAATETTAEKE